MSTRIKLTVEGQELEGELNDSETAAALRKRLPLEAKLSRWGEEYYGNIGATLDVTLAPDARTEMAPGELAYWIPGNALCIFFGPTPASLGDEPRAASEVNPIGQLTGDLEPLRAQDQSVRIKLEALE